MSSSGSASYATTATNYGKNANDSYYILGAPGQIAGNLNVGGNLTVQGSTTLVGPTTAGAVTAGAVTAGAVTMTGGSSSAPLQLSLAPTLPTPATVSATTQCGRVSYVSAGTILWFVDVLHTGVTANSVVMVQLSNDYNTTFASPGASLNVVVNPGVGFKVYSNVGITNPGFVNWFIAAF